MIDDSHGTVSMGIDAAENSPFGPQKKKAATKVVLDESERRGTGKSAEENWKMPSPTMPLEYDDDEIRQPRRYQIWPREGIQVYYCQLYPDKLRLTTCEIPERHHGNGVDADVSRGNCQVEINVYPSPVWSRL